MRIELHRIEPETGTRELLKTARTNDGGRTDELLLESDGFSGGEYELVFDVGEYHGEEAGSLPFLNRVPVRFCIADPSAHYHVPLLTSAWSYRVYRGS